MPTPPTDSDCIFCKIVAGEIPCHRVYEDDHVLAFLDVGPLSDGHTLVIPKAHYTTLDQVPAKDAAAIGTLLPALARAIAKATGGTAYNILQNNGEEAGQEVPHVHFHLIPRRPCSSRNDAVSGNGLPSGGWPSGEIDHEKAADFANQIDAALNIND